MLCGLSLLLSNNVEGRDQRNMNVGHVLAALLKPEFSRSLQVGQGLYVAHGPSYLYNNEVSCVLFGYLSKSFLNLICYVRNYLDAFAEEVSPPFLLDNRRVDLACCDVVALGDVDVQESLVGADVHVGFSPVFGDEDFPVNVRGHGSSVIVEVGIDFDGGYFESAGLHYFADRSSDYAFADTGHYAAGNEYEFCQRVTWRGLTTNRKD